MRQDNDARTEGVERKAGLIIWSGRELPAAEIQHRIALQCSSASLQYAMCKHTPV